MHEFFETHGNRLFYGYVILAAIFIAWIDTEFNAPYSMAFRYLTLPVTLIVYLITFLGMKSWVEENSRLMVIAWPAIVSLSILLLSGPYLAFANTLIGEQKPVHIEATIIDLHRHGDTYSAEMLNESDTLRLHITKKEYNELKAGDSYTREMHEGGLGFMYTKRW